MFEKKKEKCPNGYNTKQDKNETIIERNSLSKQYRRFLFIIYS